jgi:hypothetical protein
MAASDSNDKKRKAQDMNNVVAGDDDIIPTTTSSSNKKAVNNVATTTTTTTTYSPLTLAEIRSRIVALMDRVPPVDDGDGDGALAREKCHEWAAQLQAVIEEFNLLLSLVSAATYKWGTDRSGAADQSLGLLSGELATSQDQISSTVTPRLTNILAPVVDLVVDRTEITTDSNNDKKKVKQNYFTQKQVDPEFLNLCRTILGRNAKLIRQVCLANFNKVAQCIGDFLQAQEKDSQHDSRGFSY